MLVSKLWTENFNKEEVYIYITMIICIFRIDLFVSLLISTRQIKERVTSARVINYSQRKRRMKGGIGSLACIIATFDTFFFCRR